jgi:DNA-binding IclR family transcriptional regulator
MAQSLKPKKESAGTQQQPVTIQPKTASAGPARTKPPDRYFSRAIGNALSVLETLQASSSPLTLSQVTSRTRLPKSSAFRILRTLEITGYAERVDGDRFRLGDKGPGFFPGKLPAAIADAAIGPMRQLSREFRETVSLAALFKNHIEVTAVLESPQRVRMGNVVGGVIPPHASSLGKCIAAFQSDEDRDRLIRSFGLMKWTEKTITQELVLHRELELVRARGYATDLEESALDGCCLGAPILNRDGKAVGAVSISMPKMRFTNPERLIAAVRDAAAEITKDLAKNSPAVRGAGAAGLP